jgi:DNA-binding transcriptional MerR regulator
MDEVQDLTAGGMAKAINRSIDTVRELERRGIIQSRRDSANRRIFSLEQLARAQAHYARKSA